MRERHLVTKPIREYFALGGRLYLDPGRIYREVDSEARRDAGSPLLFRVGEHADVFQPIHLRLLLLRSSDDSPVLYHRVLVGQIC
jgi:hypothetical protein